MAQIPVQHKGSVVYFAEVDDEMYSEVIQYVWHVIGGGRTFNYACRTMRKSNGHKAQQSLHQFIMGVEPGSGKMIDHIDRNPRNNRRENLRFVTHRENAWNSGKPKRKNTSTSQYIGVDKFRGGWRAHCSNANGQLYLGTYPTEELAALARDYYVRRLYDSTATLNFPDRDILPEKKKTLLGRKYITPIEKRGGRKVFGVQITATSPRINKQCDTLEEAIEFRNQKLKELGVPIPD